MTRRTVPVPRVGVERRIADQLRARPLELQHRVLDRRGGAQRAGAHQRRSVRVRHAAVQRRHRHVLQLARRARTCPAVTKFVGPGLVLNPLGCTEHAGVRPTARSGERRGPAVPAREHRDPNAGRRHGRRAGLPVHRSDDDRAAQLGERRADGRRRAPGRSRRTPDAGRATT